MSSMGNAFVACGVIYCIDSYSGKTTINFAYDTKTEKQWKPNIQFTNQYNYNFMVAYNPRERCCTPGTTIVWSLIQSLLRNTKLITWSSGVGLENTLIRDAFLWYKDDEETGQFTVDSKLDNHDSKIKEEQWFYQSNKLNSTFDRTLTLQNLPTLSCF